MKLHRSGIVANYTILETRCADYLVSVRKWSHFKLLEGPGMSQQVREWPQMAQIEHYDKQIGFRTIYIDDWCAVFQKSFTGRSAVGVSRQERI